MTEKTSRAIGLSCRRSTSTLRKFTPVFSLCRMKDTVHWLNFLSALFGFLSAVVLAAPTIGEKRYPRLLKRAKAAEESAASPETVGIPAIVAFVGFALVVTLAAFAFADPSAFGSALSFRNAGVVLLLVAVGAWALAFVIMAAVHAVIRFASGLEWLHAKELAGGIGFLLLAISFVLLVVSTGVDLFYKAPPA